MIFISNLQTKYRALDKISEGIFFSNLGKNHDFRRGTVPIFGPQKWPNECPEIIDKC